MNGITILQGDALEVLKTLPDESVHCVVTSPPYWGLRDYGCEGQIGLESTPELYVAKMVAVFGEVWRALRADGTLWLNMGDCYATGAGAVGECPGGGEQGERWKGYRGTRRAGKAAYLTDAMGPLVQPNRMPIVGLKPKDLVGIPWMLAFALRSDGWYLRSDIIWHKPNPMPESVTDRPTKSHEYIFLLSKSERYFYDADEIAEQVAPSQVGRVREDTIGGASWTKRNQHSQGGTYKTAGKWNGEDPQSSGRRMVEGVKAARANGGAHDSPFGEKRNKRSVWTVNTAPFPEAHFATFPEELIKPCILAGCPAGGTVLDPFGGSGTTALVARANGCKAILIELNPEYIEIAKRRLAQEHLEFV